MMHLKFGAALFSLALFTCVIAIDAGSIAQQADSPAPGAKIVRGRVNKIPAGLPADVIPEANERFDSVW